MMEGFPQALSRLRRERGLNQRTAAAELRISQALLSHYENGLREPGLEFVSRVCEYYGVSADYLLGRTEIRDSLVLKNVDTPAQRSLAGKCAGGFTELINCLDGDGGEETRSVVADILTLTLYKLYRTLGGEDGCGMPEDEAFPLCRAALVLDELRLKRLAAGKPPLGLDAAGMAGDVEARLQGLRETAQYTAAGE